MIFSQNPSTAPAAGTDAARRTLRSVLIGVLVALCTVALASAPAQAAPGWTIRSAPASAKQAHAELQAVSCPSATFCLAVGSRVGVDAQYAPLAESFNGKSWKVASTSVPGVSAQGFSAVSCVDKGFCLATTDDYLGDSAPHVARWNGKSWQPLALGTAHVTSLDDVQCRSHSNCTMVGSVSRKGAVWRYNGKAWHQQTLPAASGRSLSAVSCPSTTVCYVAGGLNPYTAGTPYVLRGSGSTWHKAALPKITGRLSDISCTSTTRCTAVGVRGANEDAALVADLSAGKWHYSSIKTKTYSPTAAAVACTSSACTAIVSFYASDDSIANAIAVRGKTGGFVKSAQQFPDLNGLSCSGTSCIVVGSTLVFDRSGFTIGSQNTPATAYRRHGLKLARFTVPQPDGRVTNGFNQLSCAGGTCAAIDNSAVAGSIWLRKSATATWQAVAGTANKQYNDVSCTSATFCMAVGQGTSLRYDGSTWTSQSIPHPDGKDKDDIGAVSCVSPIWCEAVGTTGTYGDEKKLLAVHWSGTGGGWTVDDIPSPAGTDSLSGLADISCSSTSDCLAVGYQLGSDGPEPVAAAFHDASWHLTSTAGLPKTTSLANVSCWAANGCMTTSPGDYGDPAAAVWNGSTFTNHPIVGNTPTANDVSCTSATSCTIAGVYFGVNRYGSQLIEHWNGSGWTIVATPTVSGDQPAFQAVSCAPSGGCTAVGSVSRAYDIALVGTGTV